MANYDISVEGSEFKDQWDQFVLNHPLGNFFLLYDWLEIVQWKTEFEFKPLVIRSGGNLSGIMPIFIKKTIGFTICMSPPPKVASPWMGPLIAAISDKQYRVEKKIQKIVEVLHDFLVNQLGCDYIRLNCVSGLDDVRPFKWKGYQCNPVYTYFLNISDKHEVFEKFDGRIRTGIRKARQNGLTYKHADNNMAPQVIKAVSERYKEQGLSFALNRELIDRILTSRAGDFIETTGVFDNEGFVSGNILIKFNNRVHHWIGGIQPSRNQQGANELLHWSGIERYADEGVFEYEFMGANTRHLCDHKSKYNPELRVFYSCEWHNNKGKLVDWAGSLLKRKKAD